MSGSSGQPFRSQAAVLQANINTLRRHNPRAADRLEAQAHKAVLTVIRSRAGLPVPIVRREHRDIGLHSRYDPLREAERAAEHTAGSGFVIVLGLGLGYHITPLLTQRQLEAVVVVDRDAALARAMLGLRDLTAVLGDPRLKILIDPDMTEVEQSISHRYLPAIHGRLETVVLQGRQALDRDWFTAVAATVRTAAQHAVTEYHTQRKLGRRWFMNTLVNLGSGAAARAMQSGAVEKAVPADRPAVIAAAGPSLRRALTGLRDRHKRCSIIATDSALPVLLAAGVRPALVVSIDCQHATYHHLLAGTPAGTTAVVDIAGPPIALRAFSRLALVASGHPLARYLQHRLGWPRTLDLSGGTVTYAALALALELGICDLEVVGADFAYPDRMPYCVDTYLDRYFRARQSRLTGLEQLHLEFVFSEPGLARVEGVERLYTATRMQRYRALTEALVDRYGARLDPIGGAPGSFRLTGYGDRQQPHGSFSPPAAAGVSEPTQAVRATLLEYRQLLTQLTPQGSYTEFTARLKAAEYEAWVTLLPLLPAFYNASAATWSAGAADARSWALDRLSRILERYAGVPDYAVTGHDVVTGVVSNQPAGLDPA